MNMTKKCMMPPSMMIAVTTEPSPREEKVSLSPSSTVTLGSDVTSNEKGYVLSRGSILLQDSLFQETSQMDHLCELLSTISASSPSDEDIQPIDTVTFEHSLNFQDSHERLQALRTLSNALKDIPTISALDFTGCKLGVQGIEAARSLFSSKRIQKLYLGHCGLTSDATQLLCELLLDMCPPHLTVLQFGDNPCGTGGAWAMARVLQQSHSLHSLQLAQVSGTVSGLLPIVQAVRSITSLRTLNVSYNPLGLLYKRTSPSTAQSLNQQEQEQEQEQMQAEDHVVFEQSSFRNHTHTTNYSVHNNMIANDNDGAHHHHHHRPQYVVELLGHSLRHHTQLQELSLQDCALTETSLLLFLASLGDTVFPELTYLNLADNDLYVEDVWSELYAWMRSYAPKLFVILLHTHPHRHRTTANNNNDNDSNNNIDLLDKKWNKSNNNHSIHNSNSIRGDIHVVNSDYNEHKMQTMKNRNKKTKQQQQQQHSSYFYCASSRTSSNSSTALKHLSWQLEKYS